MRKRAKQQTTFILAALVLGALAGAGTGTGAEVEQTTYGILMKLLHAVEAGDYDRFVADGNAVFKAGITKQMLEGVSAQIAPRMKKGYQPIYLGQLRKQGCNVYLWKMVFKDGGDDTLVKLVLKDEKVAGFWLQ